MQYLCGNTAVDVHDVCAIARSAGDAIMQVYATETQVKAGSNKVQQQRR
jgi:hypothetical protein